MFLYFLCIVSPSVHSCLFPIFAQVYRPLPPGGKTIAVNQYHIIYHIYYINRDKNTMNQYHIIYHIHRDKNISFFLSFFNSFIFSPCTVFHLY